MPPFQQTVSGAALPLGVVGELAFDGPLRAIPAWLRTPEAQAANNIVGRVVTYVTGATSSFPATPDDPKDPKPAEVRVGGTGAFAGIIAHPKVYPYAGINYDGSEMVLPNGMLIEALQMGQIIVEIEGTVTPGMGVAYNNDTGEIAVVAAGAEPEAGFTLIEGAETTRWKSSTPSLAVIKLTR